MRHTEATKQKLSAMRTGDKNPFFGKKHTPTTRKKLAAVLRRYSKTRTYELSAPTVRMPRRTNLAYLAGIVDGEGSIRFKAGRPFVAIYNGSEPLKAWLWKATGIEPRWADYRGRVPGWQWLLQSAANVYVACNALLPYLVVKRDEAQEVIDFLEKKYGEKLRSVCGRKDAHFVDGS